MGKVKIGKAEKGKGKHPEKECLEPLEQEPLGEKSEPLEVEAESESASAAALNALEESDGPGLGTAELKKQLADLGKQTLYLQADFANYKRNAEQERGRSLELGKELALKDLFPIIEHLDRAIASGVQYSIDASVLKGLELVKKELLRILEKYQVERIKTVGEKFDPKIHDAISVIDSPDHPPGTIVLEHQPGFQREGKVLQPAQVVVAKDRPAT